jgi:hypothetical protein
VEPVLHDRDGHRIDGVSHSCLHGIPGLHRQWVTRVDDEEKTGSRRPAPAGNTVAGGCRDRDRKSPHWQLARCCWARDWQSFRQRPPDGCPRGSRLSHSAALCFRQWCSPEVNRGGFGAGQRQRKPQLKRSGSLIMFAPVVGNHAIADVLRSAVATHCSRDRTDAWPPGTNLAGPGVYVPTCAIGTENTAIPYR